MGIFEGIPKGAVRVDKITYPFHFRSVSGDFRMALLPAGAYKVKEYFNTAAFEPATVGTFGAIRRNSLRGPGYAGVDASIFKDLLLGERIHAQSRAEAFNSINRANFWIQSRPFPPEPTARSRRRARRVWFSSG